MLTRGAHSKGKNKTKQGSVGIVASAGPYKDVSGKWHYYSQYKIKIGNIRIFCAPAEPKQIVKKDNQDRVVYEFNGAGFGH